MMYFRFLFITLSFFFLFACKRNKDFPKDILLPAKMKVVLYDLMLAEAMQDAKPDLYPPGNTELRDQVLKSHGLNKKTFQKSLDYYRQHPQVYKQLADSLAAYATRLSADVLQLPEKTKLNGRHITDSARSLGDFKRNR
ncbi:MAG: DUF4296 domain-containing protein [Bacteroidota bacterium]|jgi:hypothetical protein